jgi:guanylate kinase
MPSENDGVMIVLSSPSGAGKTTLVKMLSENR